MNLALWDTINEQILSYPRADDQPVVNLDPRYLVLQIVKEARPDDVEGFTVRQRWTVDVDALEWRHGWELIELPAPTPQPEWPAFKRHLLAHPEINVLLGGGITAAPAAALSLPATLLNAAGGGQVDDFRAAWLQLRRAGLISVELLAEVRLLAVDCHLPEQFVAALGGTTRPAAEYLGQEWVSADGVLWRVTQARNEDGTFAVDNPATTERESLSWEVVQ